MNLIRYNYPRSSFLPVSRRGPWHGLESEFDRLFEAAASGLASAAYRNRFPVDLYEDNENVYVRAELPGVDRADINLELADDTLTITSQRKGAAGDDGETETSALSRAVSLPVDVQADKVTAAHENGLLTVTLPKREEAKPKKINIAVK